MGNNVVRARLVDGPPEAEVTFAATALVAKEPAATAVSGLVLDNTDRPVPGATVTFEGTTLSTRSDESGFFRLAGAPAGTAHLRVNGSTVERPGVWPSLEFLITIISGRDNSMGRPIFLPELEIENALAVDENTGGVLTIHDLPGFALEIAPGSVTFPGGRRSGTITVTPVHSDKVPMPPNFGQQPRFVITIQPGGAHFDPPARVAFPNVDGLAPGQVTELYSFDHDLARFVGIGPGTVTGDGTRIVSDPGVGIAKAGWHGGGDPTRPGTCHDCGECKQPSGGACVADDSRTPRQKAPDDCRIERCRGGRAESDMTNQEPAKQIAGNCYEELCPPQYRSLDLGDEPTGVALLRRTVQAVAWRCRARAVDRHLRPVRTVLRRERGSHHLEEGADRHRASVRSWCRRRRRSKWSSMAAACRLRCNLACSSSIRSLRTAAIPTSRRRRRTARLCSPMLALAPTTRWVRAMFTIGAIRPAAAIVGIATVSSARLC